MKNFLVCLIFLAGCDTNVHNANVLVVTDTTITLKPCQKFLVYDYHYEAGGVAITARQMRKGETPEEYIVLYPYSPSIAPITIKETACPAK